MEQPSAIPFVNWVYNVDFSPTVVIQYLDASFPYVHSVPIASLIYAACLCGECLRPLIILFAYLIVYVIDASGHILNIFAYQFKPIFENVTLIDAVRIPLLCAAIYYVIFRLWPLPASRLENSESLDEKITNSQVDTMEGIIENSTNAKGRDAEGFSANKSQVSDDRLSAFLASEIVASLQSVPGIGPKAEELLGKRTETDEPVTTTYQLIGKYLSLRGRDMTSDEHMDAFWHYLKSRGISSHRSGIVRCIAEKVNIMIPGLYQPKA